MPGELGDEDEVVAGADEAGQACVAQGVGGQLDVGLPPEAAEGEVDRPSGEPLSFEGQQQCGSVAVGQLGAPSPGLSRGGPWKIGLAKDLSDQPEEAPSR